jgi:hypothetical protein
MPTTKLNLVSCNAVMKTYLKSSSDHLLLDRGPSAVQIMLFLPPVRYKKYISLQHFIMDVYPRWKNHSTE